MALSWIHGAPNPVSTRGLSQCNGARKATDSVLCLSNGHGEDAVAAAILAQLKEVASENQTQLKLEALPLVGIGDAYRQNGIKTLGPSKVMPSGGFIYMDFKQLLRDLRAGLLTLTIDQWRAVEHWVEENPDGFVLAVGDVFPLVFAWIASRKSEQSMDYAFIGTAKSEYYVRGDDGCLLPRTWPVDSYLFSGSVYYPWEQSLMANKHCRLVVPRDSLTCVVLRERLQCSDASKVQFLGNPMMDALHPTSHLLEYRAWSRLVTLLPGSRAPEVYANWLLLLQAAEEISQASPEETIIFLVPIAPSLKYNVFVEALRARDWHFSETVRLNQEMMFGRRNAKLLLLKSGFADACHRGEAAIAMSGTGTEQMVGLGKPVFTLPGAGPQFTFSFAEAQSRLLGNSIFLCSDPVSVASKFLQVMSDRDVLEAVRNNGLQRMGTLGGSRRIAEKLFKIFNCSDTT